MEIYHGSIPYQSISISIYAEIYQNIFIAIKIWYGYCTYDVHISAGRASISDSHVHYTCLTKSCGSSAESSILSYISLCYTMSTQPCVRFLHNIQPLQLLTYQNGPTQGQARKSWGWFVTANNSNHNMNINHADKEGCLISNAFNSQWTCKQK